MVLSHRSSTDALRDEHFWSINKASCYIFEISSIRGGQIIACHILGAMPHLNQCWIFAKQNGFQKNWNQVTIIFIEKYAFENVLISAYLIWFRRNNHWKYNQTWKDERSVLEWYLVCWYEIRRKRLTLQKWHKMSTSTEPLLSHDFNAMVLLHYDDVVVGAMASQIISLTIVNSKVYSGADQENIKVPHHWPLCGEFTGDRWIPRTNGQ